MKTLTESDLDSFQKAILTDYGIKLEGDELYQAASNLLQFFESLIKFKTKDEEIIGSKTNLDNPLNTNASKDTMK